MTGLPNHLLGRNRFELARAYADRSDSKVALLFLDLDNFKTVNDSLGHTQGDGMLKSVARRLHESVRETDTLCRQGGDEFLVILTDLLDSDTIAFLSAKLLEQVSLPIIWAISRFRPPPLAVSRCTLTMAATLIRCTKKPIPRCIRRRILAAMSVVSLIRR